MPPIIGPEFHLWVKNSIFLPSKMAVFGPQMKFRVDYGGVEYSDGPEKNFSKSLTSQLSNAVFGISISPLDMRNPRFL